MSIYVIKIGTSLLRGDKNNSTAEVIDRFSHSIAKRKKNGDQIILVSSGAVGLGCLRLELKERPLDLVSLQAVAAIGQGHLMSVYESCMGKYGFKVAQVLLTRAELGKKDSFRNASKTLKRLLEWEVLPVINENDAICPEELKFGDNDTLSALVASAIKADKLILLTDIDKLYSSDPKKFSEAEPITEVKNQKEISTLVKLNSSSGDWGTGGIKTKLAAAKIATSSGIEVHLADGRNPHIIEEILTGLKIGTIFHPNPQPIGSRKSWLAHAIKPLGSIQIDDGASFAIQNKGASLLLVGIKKFQGNFLANNPVKVLNMKGEEIARGLISISSVELNNSLSKLNNTKNSPVVIHRDVLVLTSENI